MFGFDEDMKQRFKVAGTFFLQIYKVTTGTMLSLFIPQKCDDHICSLTENYENRDVYHSLTFYWNAITMLLFFSYYMIELKREEWAIKYLDIDNDKPDNSLKEIIKTEPKLDKKMDQLNLLYLRTLCATCFFYGINLAITAKMIKDTYYSSSTLSCFISFSLLVLMKLYNSLIVALESVKNDKMMSAYMCEFVSFNVLDKDYIDSKQVLLEEVEKQVEVQVELIIDDVTIEDVTIEDKPTNEEIIPNP